MSHPVLGPDGELRCCRTCRAVYRSGFFRCPTDGTELAPFDADPVIGTTISDLYEVEACVGEGAMGRVYRAHHLRLQGRRVALKILLGDFAASVAMRLRFTQEAQAASLLSHPNVVSVLDFGKDEHGLLYLAMEYVEGRSLASIMAEEGPLAPARVIRLARQLCQGLDHAHGRGLVHRDFKPDNVLVVDTPGGEVARIADFGLAIFPESEDGARLTTAGTVVGTPLYIAPEQALDRPVDGRADLFGLGVSMFEMLAGVPPFDDSASAMAILQANLSFRRPRIHERAPVVVDPALEKIVLQLLAADRDERPASAAAVIEALDALGAMPSRPVGRARTARDEPVAIELVESTESDFVLPRRTGRRIAIGLVLLGGIGAAAAAMFWPLGGLGPRLQAIVAGGPTDHEAAAPGDPAASVAPLPIEGEAPASSTGPPGSLAGSADEASAGSAAGLAAVTAAGSVDASAAAAGAASPRSPRPRRGRQVGRAALADGARAGGEGEATQGDPLLAAASAAEAAREGAASEPAAAPVPAPAESSPGSSPSETPGASSIAAEPGAAPTESPPPSPPRQPAPATVAPSPRQPPRAPRPSLTARTAIQSLEVSGSLSTAEVRRGIARVEQRLSACYSAAAIRAGRDAAGDVPLRFVIGENGRAAEVSASGSPLPGLAACVTDAIAGVRTRVAPDVGEVRVSLRVHYTPRGAGGDER